MEQPQCHGHRHHFRHLLALDLFRNLFPISSQQFPIQYLPDHASPEVGHVFLPIGGKGNTELLIVKSLDCRTFPVLAGLLMLTVTLPLNPESPTGRGLI